MTAAAHNVNPVSEADARKAHRVLQAVWVIVGANHQDAVADDVQRMGATLRKAIDEADWAAAGAAVDEVRTWMSTMAGVVTSRMTYVFD